MSVSLDLNNFLTNDGAQKSSIFEEFDRLLEVNKSFLNQAHISSAHTNPDILTPTLDRNNILLNSSFTTPNDDCGNSTSVDQVCNLPSCNKEKCSKIGNLNVYNKCIFFVNNNGNKSSTKNVEKREISRNGHVQNVNVITATKRKKVHKSDEYWNQACADGNEDTTLLSPDSSTHFQADQVAPPPPKQSQESARAVSLYTVVAGGLRPIQAPLSKSGVYKKVSNNDAGAPKPPNIPVKCNVFFSSCETHGRVLRSDHFNEAYIRLEPTLDEEKQVEQSTISNRIETANRSGEKVPDAGRPVIVDQLDAVAYDILKLSNQEDNLIIDREKNEIIHYQPKLNKKTIFRVLQPGNLGLTNQILSQIVPQSFVNEVRIKRDRGRPKKKQGKKRGPKPKSIYTNPSEENIANDNSEAHRAPLSSELNQTEKPPEVKTTEHSTYVNPPKTVPELPKDIFRTPKTPKSTMPEDNSPSRFFASRTRFGRLSRQKQQPDYSSEDDNFRNILDDLKDDDFKSAKAVPTPSDPSVPPEPLAKRVRKLSAESICPTCNKIFLGKKMIKHFIVHPDHKVEKPSNQTNSIESMSLYKFLVNKVKNSAVQSEEHRSEIFLNEISDLVQQLQMRSSRLVRNTSGMHFVNLRSSKVLGIPEGYYSLDVNAIDALPDLDDQPQPIPPPPPRLDYNLSISLDDTISDAKLNLSDTMIAPSEESLLRTVDDLVKEGIKKLGVDHEDLLDHHGLHHTTNPPVMHYDHASDNAVEAVSMKETQPPPILDLSLDLFQFSSN